MGLASFLNLEADRRRKAKARGVLASAVGTDSEPESPAEAPKAKPEAPKANPRPAAKATAKATAKAPTGLVRAREEDGTYKADDPATPDVNEAYEPSTTAKKSTKS